MDTLEAAPARPQRPISQRRSLAVAVALVADDWAEEGTSATGTP